MKKLILKIINRLKRGVWVNLDIIDNEFKENMKKLLLLALTAVVMAGCKERLTLTRVTETYSVIELDSCEYIKWNITYGFQHKGNCRFCAERRKQELKEMIKEIKGE